MNIAASLPDELNLFYAHFEAHNPAHTESAPVAVAEEASAFSISVADDTTVIGLITDNDETAYRAEVNTLTKWCQENHLSLNIEKTKELVVDFRRQSREHTPSP